MAKLPRVTAKIFASNAEEGDIGQYGSALTGSKVITSDISEIQALPAYEIGWRGAVVSSRNYPTLQEMNGLQKTFSQQIAYNFQEGIPEYDAGTDYYIGSIVKVLEDGKPVLYSSLTDNNIGNNPITDATNWERLSFGGGGLEIGDIGIAPLGIDETQGKRRYLNGQLIIQEQYIQFTNKVKSAVALYPTLACTEEEWQTTATMTVGGQVGKFVVDDEGGTIRLPKIIMPIQGLTDLSKLAEIVEAGLPNIEGTLTRVWTEQLTYDSSVTPYPTKGTGIVSNLTEHEYAAAASGHGMSRTDIEFDASNSNPLYGNSNTVQQEQIQYPYFIQVATGAETEDNIINEIELNNPFSLLDYKYSEYELNNLSWLRSEGQYNSKAIYPAVYDLLLKIYNGTETKAGVSVKLSTETFTDYDFVLDTAEEIFRLPIKVKLASGKAVIGNGMSLGLTNGTSDFGLRTSETYSLSGLTSAYGKAIGSASTSGTDSASLSGNKSVGVTSAPQYSGLELSDIDLYLYFYVGETVQNANLINAGRIEEIKANKTDVDGQWVMTKAFTLASEVAVNKNTTELTYDLSDYLPNDGYNYEVIFEATAITGDISGQYMFVRLLTDYAKAMGQVAGVYLCNNRTRSSSYVNMAGNATLPVGNGRSVTVGFYQTSDNFNGSFNLWVVGYRRIGTNV